jgi:hypothetical protein
MAGSLADESTEPEELHGATGGTLAGSGVNLCIQGRLFHPYNLG